jgi:hypothetical protein
MGYSDFRSFRNRIGAAVMVSSGMANKRAANNIDASVKNLSIEELVEHLIGKCMTALEDKKIKVTIMDLVRIRALRDELAPRQPLGEVTWVDGWD